VIVTLLVADSTVPCESGDGPTVLSRRISEGVAQMGGMGGGSVLVTDFFFLPTSSTER